MKISVIIPAYNSENFLAETLDNLLGQSLREIQIITVNDGSTDSTAEIIAEYSKKHSNITPVYQENAGVSAARNNGIAHAEGKYIIFIDSDDLLSETALENIYNSLEETGADLAIFRSMRFGMGGTEFNPIVDSLSQEKTIDSYDKRLIWNFLVSNKCYRTETLRRSGVLFPPLRYSEDGAFFMQFVHKAQPKITGIYDAVFKYRRHSASVTQRIEAELVEHFSRSMQIVYDSAKASVSGADDSDGYLQEILYKNYFALINEFYRMLWAGDSETLALIGQKAKELKSRMTDETLKKCNTAVKDIGTPLFSKAEIAEKPSISVISKNPSDEFIASLYAQSMPVFELITAKNVDRENAVILSENGFAKSSEKTAKGKIKVKLNGKKALDLRFFKVISLLKRSPKFSIFPDFIIKLGALMFLKIKK